MGPSLSRMSRVRGVALAVLAAALVWAGVAASPVQADAGSPQDYLFVIDASSIRVVPEKGTAAKITLRDPRALRFTGNPYPLVRAMSVRGLLERLGWSASTSQFPRRAPLVSLSIAGERSRVVALGKAEIRDGKLILHGYGIAGPLVQSEGPGSAFLNNPAAYP